LRHLGGRFLLARRSLGRGCCRRFRPTIYFLTTRFEMPTQQAHNPLHGITLEMIVTELVAYFGWPELGLQVDIRCFTHDPSIASSLKFLRRTPWARAKVESLYLFMLRERAREARRSSTKDSR